MTRLQKAVQDYLEMRRALGTNCRMRGPVAGLYLFSGTARRLLYHHPAGAPMGTTEPCCTTLQNPVAD
ncbi:MAG: hypothetical protein ACRD1R_01525 [Acidobacteriota bacterium]